VRPKKKNPYVRKDIRKESNKNIDAVLGRIYGRRPPAVFGALKYNNRARNDCQLFFCLFYIYFLVLADEGKAKFVLILWSESVRMRISEHMMEAIS